MPKKVRASHILVKSQEQANVAFFDVTHGKDFGEVAKQCSICPSAKKGGDLGWFGRGMMVKEFETAAFAMQKGQISQPVKSQFGWHVIKLEDVK